MSSINTQQILYIGEVHSLAQVGQDYLIRIYTKEANLLLGAFRDSIISGFLTKLNSNPKDDEKRIFQIIHYDELTIDTRPLYKSIEDDVLALMQKCKQLDNKHLQSYLTLNEKKEIKLFISSGLEYPKDIGIFVCFEDVCIDWPYELDVALA